MSSVLNSGYRCCQEFSAVAMPLLKFYNLNMYKRILVAINEHLNSEVSGRYAVQFAKSCSAKLYLCFIADRRLSTSAFNKAEDAVKRLFAEAEKMGVEVEAITKTGEPVAEIATLVKHERISLAFVSTRHEDLRRKLYEGTVARSLMLQLPCSVALVRISHVGKSPPHKILLPLKSKISGAGEKAYFAAMMAQAYDSKLFVFHVSRPIAKFFHGPLHLTPIELENRMPRDIAVFLKLLGDHKIKTEKGFASGHEGRTIALEASIKRHDLIIMGASERGMLRSFIKGSPVETLLRDTPCDLIILRPKHEDQ